MKPTIENNGNYVLRSKSQVKNFIDESGIYIELMHEILNVMKYG